MMPGLVNFVSSGERLGNKVSHSDTVCLVVDYKEVR